MTATKKQSKHTPAPKHSTLSDLRKLDAEGVKLTAAERKRLGK